MRLLSPAPPFENLQFHALYFHSKIAYWLNQIDRRIDNCDQRMTVEYVSEGASHSPASR
jgi:hypothetical protein